MENSSNKEKGNRPPSGEVSYPRYELPRRLSDKWHFSHHNVLPDPANDWRLRRDPNPEHNEVYVEIIMYDGIGPNARRLNGN